MLLTLFWTRGTQQNFTKELHQTNINADVFKRQQGGAAMCINEMNGLNKCVSKPNQNIIHGTSV